VCLFSASSLPLCCLLSRRLTILFSMGLGALAATIATQYQAQVLQHASYPPMHLLTCVSLHLLLTSGKHVAKHTQTHTLAHLHS
jgi:hypothetical protein